MSKAFCSKHKEKTIEILHKYIDFIVQQDFYGQMIISWEGGIPTVIKEHATLKINDVEKIIEK